MPITVTEKYDSRNQVRGLVSGSAGQHSHELLLTVRGTASELTARTHVLSVAPTSYDGLSRLEVSLEPVHVDDGNDAVCIYEATVRYGVKEKPETNESSFSFDTSGGTQHVTQSLLTLGKYPAATAPDFKGAIGVSKDGVNGVDITVPIYSWSETHYVPLSNVTQAYKLQLMDLTGKINDNLFRGFEIGEVLFMGAGGQMRNGEDWEITYKFAASKNKTNFNVGDILVAMKHGWSYMWVKYQESTDPVAHALVQKPVAVYIERVYETANMALLGIGVQ